MKKLLYISFEDASNDASGVNKKIKGHIRTFLDEGYSVDLIAVFGDDIILLQNLSNRKIISSSFNKRITLCNWVAKNSYNYNFAYIRFQFFCPFVLRMLTALKQESVKVVMEFPTYPYCNELRQQGLRGVPKKIIDGIFAKYCSRLIDLFVAPLYEGTILGKECKSIRNGIDFKRNTIRQPINGKENQLHLLAGAMMSPWHGYDRLIKGMYHYYKNNGSRDIVFHLVGCGTATQFYQNLTQKYGLIDKVMFHGNKFGVELEYFYNIADIGISALGSHRKCIYKLNTLKVLDYVSKGIPVVCEPGEVSIPDKSKYRLTVPADDSDIDIERLIRFYDEIYSSSDSEFVAENIRKECIESCSIKAGIQSVLDYYSI